MWPRPRRNAQNIPMAKTEMISVMKKIHIILLLLVIGGIVGMSFFIKDLTTQETFASAQKKDKFVVVKVKLDKDTPVEYDAVKKS